MENLKVKKSENIGHNDHKWQLTYVVCHVFSVAHGKEVDLCRVFWGRHTTKVVGQPLAPRVLSATFFVVHRP
jgi:hypothetical protein